ncbi:MAG: beta-N-acetylhexosaminidase [Candidatus Hodarchaeales archaeon]|jgi:hypothetical protein
MLYVYSIVILGADDAGLFYGILTFFQLVELFNSQKSSVIPCLEIIDYPDFPHRGVMLDISRNKVPKMETLYALIDLLAKLKINQFQLYTEHTFAYQGHEQVWKDASPLTGEEILALDDFCKKRFIELVPNQNSFGHLHRWLKHNLYQYLAECPDGFDHPFSLSKEPFSLNPVDIRSLEFLEDLYNQLLPHFSSKQFNVGLDETFDLGEGRSREVCEKNGKGRVYLDFLLKIYSLVKKKGYSMQFWADIIFKHPELIELVPRDSIPLIWGYEDNHPFDVQAKTLSDLGFSYYVCPGTSSWNSILGRTNNAVSNLCNAAINGKLNSASGYLITDWGDHGHHQPLSVSYLGYLVGAGVSWNTNFAETIEHQNIAELLNLHVFQDKAKVMGQIAFDLGNAVNEIGYNYPNSSLLHSLLLFNQRESTMDLLRMNSVENLQKTFDFIERISHQIEKSEMILEEAELINKEFYWGVKILKFACALGIEQLKLEIGVPIDKIELKTKNLLTTNLTTIIEEFQWIWLERNRRGGLNDSKKRLEDLLNLLT